VNIKVFLVEDHQMVREALREVLIKESDIEVVGEAGDAQEALRQVEALQPDVVVLDIRLPDLNGVEVAVRLRDANSHGKVVALSAFSDRRFVAAMLRAGAAAYVSKSAAGTELVRAIRAVAGGQEYFSPDILRASIMKVRDSPTAEDRPLLARREREVLRLIAEGVRSPAIAEEMQVSLATIEVHRRNIMRKLGLRTVAELTKHAIRAGIISL
jgi:two-component system NarL family response regulator